MTHVDTRQFKKELDKLSKRELPRVVKRALTLTARTAAKFAKGNVEDDFTNRNKFTAGSVRANKVEGTTAKSMFAEYGSMQPYMALQEKGGQTTNKGKAVDVPTRSARVGRSRKKPTRKKARLSQLGKLPHFKGDDIIDDLAKFARHGKKRKQAVIESSNIKRGVYMVVRAPKKKVGAPFNLTMLHNLESASYHVSANPWMSKANKGAMKPKRHFWYWDTAFKQTVKNYRGRTIK